MSLPLASRTGALRPDRATLYSMCALDVVYLRMRLKHLNKTVLIWQYDGPPRITDTTTGHSVILLVLMQCSSTHLPEADLLGQPINRDDRARLIALGVPKSSPCWARWRERYTISELLYPSGGNVCPPTKSRLRVKSKEPIKVLEYLSF